MTTGHVSARAVLQCAKKFDSVGGVSLALIAWEFDCDPTVISALWHRLIDTDLLRLVGGGGAFDEQRYRVSATGALALMRLAEDEDTVA